MSTKTAFSIKISVAGAVADIKRQMEGMAAAVVVFFASPAYSPDQLGPAMAEAFPEAATFGCTTAGEIVTGIMMTHSLVAMAFSADTIRSARVEVIPDLHQESYSAFAAIEQYFGTQIKAMDPARYVGLILIDGLSGAEERVMDRIGDLTNVNFIGGSAGDDLRFSATHVYANGKSHTGAAVVALLEPAVPFSFLKTQSFTPAPRTLTVTKADEAHREVLEFDHRPAVEAYAEALGVVPAEVEDHFMANPLGLVFDGEPYVRSPQRIKDGSLVFYCAVKEGMELSLLRSTDIIADTTQALAAAAAENGEITAIINFNCILRTLELRQKGLTGQYGEIFATVPTIGFSTYGEQYIGHINQTATMLLFHREQ